MVNNLIAYKIYCLNKASKYVYYDSTFNFLKRKQKHMVDFNNTSSQHYNIKLYQKIRSNGGWGNWSMVPIKVSYYNDTKQLLKEYHRIYYKTHIQHITKRNIYYYLHNKDHILELNKQYYINNKPAINEYNRERYIANKC